MTNAQTTNLGGLCECTFLASSRKRFLFWSALALLGLLCLSLTQGGPSRSPQTRRARSMRNFPIPPLSAP